MFGVFLYGFGALCRRRFLAWGVGFALSVERVGFVGKGFMRRNVTVLGFERRRLERAGQWLNF